MGALKYFVGSKKMRSKKAQAAMEFLMTYGWAILVVLVVIGALAYFGVLNPQQFLPTKCQLPVGLTCSDYALSSSSGKTQIVITNGLGTDVRINQMVIGSDTGLVFCKAGSPKNGDATAMGIILTTGDSYRHAFADKTEVVATYDAHKGDKGGICFFEPGVKTGIRVKGPIGVTYRNLRTTLDQTINGTIITDLSG
ncbi:MAG: hypothetical protein AABX69_02800 [Nanoarchaeota archaeon]